MKSWYINILHNIYYFIAVSRSPSRSIKEIRLRNILYRYLLFHLLATTLATGTSLLYPDMMSTGMVYSAIPLDLHFEGRKGNSQDVCELWRHLK